MGEVGLPGPEEEIDFERLCYSIAAPIYEEHARIIERHATASLRADLIIDEHCTDYESITNAVEQAFIPERTIYPEVVDAPRQTTRKLVDNAVETGKDITRTLITGIGAALLDGLLGKPKPRQ